MVAVKNLPVVTDDELDKWNPRLPVALDAAYPATIITQHPAVRVTSVNFVHAELGTLTAGPEPFCVVHVLSLKPSASRKAGGLVIA